MAKKSSKNTLFDFLALILSGAVFGILAMPFITSKLAVAGKETTSTMSGYDLLNFEADSGLATVVLLLVIFASILALFALIKLLVDEKIISNKTVAKCADLCLLLSALAVVVMAIVAMIVVPSKCSAEKVGSLTVGTFAGWVALVILLVDALVALVMSWSAHKN